MKTVHVLKRSSSTSADKLEKIFNDRESGVTFLKKLQERLGGTFTDVTVSTIEGKWWLEEWVVE